MLDTPDRLYHTKRSAGNTLRELPDETGEIGLLKRAIKRGGFEYQELSKVSLEGLTRMEEAVTEILAQIVTMREMLPVRQTRLAIAEKLLFLRGMLAIPLMPFKDPEDELYMPNVTLHSIDVQMQLDSMLIEIRNQKIRLGEK